MKSVIPQALNEECIKCTKVLKSFIDVNIPIDIINRARGIAVLSAVKAGFIWAGKTGSGLVIARLPDGTWSAPSAIGTAGVSVGGQIGAEITDFVIILNSEAAVKAFAKSTNVTLGGNLSVAAGPHGRTGEVSGTAMSAAAVYSYSKSKGLFAGASIEGSVIVARSDANEKFYGQKVTAKQILSGEIPVPEAARDLHTALDVVSAANGMIPFVPATRLSVSSEASLYFDPEEPVPKESPPTDNAYSEKQM